MGKYDEIPNETLLNYIRDLIKTGFYSEEAIMDKIPHFEKKKINISELKLFIHNEYQQHNFKISQLEKNTDFQRLSKFFDSLCKERVIALHKAGYRNEDAFEQIDLVLEKLNKKPFGYVFYIERELFHALESNILYLSFGSFVESEKTASNGKSKLEMGYYFVNRLKSEGFEVNWNEDEFSKIAINPFYWNKKYDGEDWSMNRSVNIINSI